MHHNPPIAGLLTDFGSRDHYVGVMKAVISSVCRGIQIIDITHAVEAHNIAQGAYLLWSSYRYFPGGSILVGVVDPGVGSGRGIIGAKTRTHTFLAPNNGLLDLVLWEEKVSQVTSIRMEKVSTRSLLPKTISSTFHARDIFAPLAAHLASGIRLETLGGKTAVNWIEAPFVEDDEPLTTARVLHVDTFGNVITNIRTDLQGVRSCSLLLKVGRRLILTWTNDYESIANDTPCLIAGSSGLVEIVMNKQSAASFLSLKQSDVLQLFYKD